MKHVHHDLIIEWAKETSKAVQYKSINDGWIRCQIDDVVSDEVGTIEFRFKPREFIKGHWYPCYYDDGTFYIKRSNGNVFYSSGNYSSIAFTAEEFASIGESLGDVKIGE